MEISQRTSILDRYTNKFHFSYNFNFRSFTQPMLSRILVIVFFLSPIYLKAQDSEFQAYLDSANLYQLSGDTMEVYYLTKALRLQPQNPTLYELRAYAKAYVKKDYKKYGPASAIKDLDIAIKIDPKKAVYYEQRGYFKYLTENYLSALGDLNKAIKYDKNKSSAYRKRGDIYWKFENYPRAGNDFHKASSLDTASIYNLRKVGDCFYELGNYYDAISFYNQAIRKSESRKNFDDVFSEDYALSLLYKSNAQGGSRAIKKAIEGYTKVIDYNEKFEGPIEYTQEAYRYRGVAKLSVEERGDGCKDLKTAVSIGDKEAKNYIESYCEDSDSN
jgi:tetratricopeptide (TPR) repeat protein